MSTPCKASGKASCLDPLLDLLQFLLDVLQLVLDFRHPGVRDAPTQFLASLLGDLAIAAFQWRQDRLFVGSNVRANQ